MVTDATGLAETSPSPAELARVRAHRVAHAAVRQWTGVHSPGHSAVRAARLRQTWPELADALDGLAAAADGLSTDLIGVACPMCRARTERIRADVDPRTAARVFRVEPCGHHVGREEATEMWRRGAQTHTTPITGATLIAAERGRQRGEEGHTDDLGLDHAELSWAAWSLLDRAARDADVDDPDEVPEMWPWGAETWPADKSRLRRLIIAGALIAAEIDRSLAGGETP